MRKDKNPGQYSDGDIYNYVLNEDNDYPHIQPNFSVNESGRIENDNHVIYKTDKDYVIYGYDFKNQTKYLDTNKQNQILKTVTNIDKDGKIEINDIGFCIIKTKFYETHHYAHDINQYTLKVLYPTKLSIAYNRYKEDNPSLKFEETPEKITEIVDCTETFDNNNNTIHTTVFARFPSNEYIDFQKDGIQYNDAFKPDFRYWYKKESIDKDGIVIFNPSTGTLSLKSEYIKNNQEVEIYSEVLESLDSFFKKSNSITHNVRFYKQLPMKYDIENNTQIIYLNEKIEKGLEAEKEEENKQILVNGMAATGLTISFSTDEGYKPVSIELKDLSSNYTFSSNDYVQNGSTFVIDAHKVALNHKYQLKVFAGMWKLKSIFNSDTILEFDNLDKINFTVSADPSKKQKAILINGKYFGNQDPSELTTDNAEAISEYLSNNENTINIIDINFKLSKAPKEYAIMIINGFEKTSSINKVLDFTSTGNADAIIVNETGYSSSNDEIIRLGDVLSGGIYSNKNGSVAYKICKNYDLKYKIKIVGKSGTELEGLEDYGEFDTAGKTWSRKASSYGATESDIKDLYATVAVNVYLQKNDGSIKLQLCNNIGTNYVGTGVQLKVEAKKTDSDFTTIKETITTDNNGCIQIQNLNPNYKQIRLTIKGSTPWKFIDSDKNYSNTFTFDITNSSDVKKKIYVYFDLSAVSGKTILNYNGSERYCIINNGTDFPWLTNGNNGSWFKKYGNLIIPTSDGGDVFEKVTGKWRLPNSDSDWIGANIIRNSSSSPYNIQSQSLNVNWYTNGYYVLNQGLKNSNEIWYWNAKDGKAVRIYESATSGYPKGCKIDMDYQIPVSNWVNDVYMQILLVKTSTSYKTEAINLTTAQAQNIFGSETPKIYGTKSINHSSPSIISDIYSDEEDNKEIIFGGGEDDISNDETNDETNDYSNETYKEEKETDEFGTVQIEEMPDLILPNDISIESRNKVKYSSSNESVVSLVYYDYDPEFGIEKEISSYDEVDSDNGHILKPKLRVWNIGESMITATYEDDENYASNAIKYKVIVKSKGLPKITLDENEFEIIREVATIIDEDYDNPDPLSSNQTFQSPTPNLICEEDIPIHFDYYSSNNNIATHYSDGNMIISDIGTVKVTITLRETKKFKTANVSYKLKIIPPKEKTKTILETEKSYYKVRFSEYTDKPIYRIYDIYGGEHQHLICEINSKSAFKKIKDGSLTLVLKYKKKNIQEYIIDGIKYNLTYNDGITPYKYKSQTYYNSLDEFFGITDEANGGAQLFDTENITYSEDLTNAYVKLNCAVVYNEENQEAYYIFNKALQNRLDKDMNSFVKGTIPGTYIDKHLTCIMQEDESYIEWETWPIYSANFETYGIQTNGKAYKHIIEAEIDELSQYGIGKYQYFGTSQFFVDISNANGNTEDLMVKHNYNDNDLRYQVFKCPFTSNNTDDDVEYSFSSSIPTVANPNDNGNVVIYKTGKVKIMINSTETTNFTSAETGYILDIIAKDDPLLDTVYNKYIYYMDLNKLENVFDCPEISWSNTDPDAKLIFRIHDGGDYLGTTWNWIDIDDIDDIPDEDIDDLDDELPDTTEPDDPEEEQKTYYLTLNGINVGKITETQYNTFKDDAIVEMSDTVVEIPQTKFNLTLYGKDGFNHPISENEVINNYILNGRQPYQKISLQFELDEGQTDIFHYQNSEGFIDFSIEKNVDIYDIKIHMNMYPVLDATSQYVAYFLKGNHAFANEAVGLTNSVARVVHDDWYVVDDNCKMTGTGLDETYHCYSSNYDILYILADDTNTKIEQITKRDWANYKSSIDLRPIEGTNSIIIGYLKNNNEEEEIIYGAGEGEDEANAEDEKEKLKLADFKTEITFIDEKTGEEITDDNNNVLKAKVDSAGNITIDNGITNRIIHVLVKSVETDNFNAKYHLYNLLVSPSMGSVEMVIENPIMDVRVNPDETLTEDFVIDKPTIQHRNTDPDVMFRYAIYLGDDDLKDDILPWYASTFDAEQRRTGVDWEAGKRTGSLLSPRYLLPTEDSKPFEGNGYVDRLEGTDAFGHNYSIEIESSTGAITLAKSGEYPPCNIVINVICFMYASEHFPEACIFYNYNILEKKDTHLSIDTSIFTRLQPDVKDLFTLPQIKTNNTDTNEIQYYVMIRDVGRVIHGNDTWIDDEGNEYTFTNKDGTSDTYWEFPEGHYCYNYDSELSLAGGEGNEETLKNLYTPSNPYTINSYPQTIGSLFEIRGNGSIIYSNESARHVLNIWTFSKETTNYKKDSLFYNLEITVKEKPQLGVYPQKFIVRISSDNPKEQYIESPKVTCTNTDSSHQLIYQFNKVEKTIGNTTYPAAGFAYDNYPFTLDKAGNVIVSESATDGDKICVKLSCPSTKNYGYVETFYGIECKNKEEPHLEVQSTLNLTRTVTVGSEVFPGPTIKHKNNDKKVNITYESSDTSVVCITHKGALLVYKTGSATITVKIHESENFKEEEKTCSVSITQQEIPSI